MLQNTKELYGNEIVATDGEIGTLADFYFDDKDWVIRYVVADTGAWLLGRLVLFSPYSLREGGLKRDVLHVDLHRAQIQASPSIESHVPVSRQFEADYCKYYDLPIYWPAGLSADRDIYSTRDGMPMVQMDGNFRRCHREDNHLRSAKAVIGFHIMAADGGIGHVSGFMVDDRGWAIPALVVETGHWYSGKEILVSCNNVNRIGYAVSTVFVNLSRSEIQKTAENDLETAEKDLARMVTAKARDGDFEIGPR
jgi:hypothetical protein